MVAERYERSNHAEAERIRSISITESSELLDRAGNYMQGLQEANSERYGGIHVDGTLGSVDGNTSKAFYAFLVKNIKELVRYYQHNSLQHLLPTIKMSQLTDKSIESLFGNMAMHQQGSTTTMERFGRILAYERISSLKRNAKTSAAGLSLPAVTRSKCSHYSQVAHEEDSLFWRLHKGRFEDICKISDMRATKKRIASGQILSSQELVDMKETMVGRADGVHNYGYLTGSYDKVSEDERKAMMAVVGLMQSRPMKNIRTLQKQAFGYGPTIQGFHGNRRAGERMQPDQLFLSEGCENTTITDTDGMEAESNLFRTGECTLFRPTDDYPFTLIEASQDHSRSRNKPGSKIYGHTLVFSKEDDTSETIAFRRDQTRPPPPVGHGHMKFKDLARTNDGDSVSFELSRNLQGDGSIVLHMKREHFQFGKRIAAEYEESLSVEDTIDTEESHLSLPDSEEEMVEDIQLYGRGQRRGRGSRYGLVMAELL